MSGLPKIGSVWSHHINGGEYVVYDITNKNTSNRYYPIRISYRGVSNGRRWSEPVDNFFKTMIKAKEKAADNKRVDYSVSVLMGGGNTKIVWMLNGTTHCEHGPAIWWQDGTYDFYLNGKQLPQYEWEKQVFRRWDIKTKRSTKIKDDFPLRSKKAFLVTECRREGLFGFKRERLYVFDCMIEMDEFILSNETDKVWYEWEEVSRRCKR